MDSVTWGRGRAGPPSHPVVPAELAEAKIRAACAERMNSETWILARTDARAVYGLDEAMRRAEH
jgi:2,3-dimethylmalate lyase